MIGEKIQQLRRVNGLTVRRLAEIAEVTPSMISNFENNQKIPGKKVISKLAKALNISEDELLKELKSTIGYEHLNAANSLKYLEKLKIAESVKSEEAMKLISNLIDFCVDNEKKNEKLNVLKSIFN